MYGVGIESLKQCYQRCGTLSVLVTGLRIHPECTILEPALAVIVASEGANLIILPMFGSLWKCHYLHP